MRILHFSYDHPDNPWCGGGGARRTWGINRILAREHHITVVCGGFPGMAAQRGPFEVRFQGRPKGYVESRLKYVLKSRSIDIRPYDIVVEDFSVYAPIFPRLRGRPRITVIHARYGISALRYRGLYGLMSILGEYGLLPLRRYVIVVSPHLKRLTSSGAHVSVIGQGVDLPPGLPRPSEEYVIYLGRLDMKVKGLDLLLKAWACIPKRNRTMPLHIIGGGDKRPVEKLIKSLGVDQVNLVGRVDHNAVFHALARAAFLCIPSRSEGFGLAAVEAMALGKPVVATDIPSLRRLIPQDIAGLLIPSDNYRALAAAIEDLLNDQEKRFRLSRGALREGRKFSWEKVAEEQESFYLRVLELNGGGGDQGKER